MVTKTNGWQFNWKQESANPERRVYTLKISGNNDVVQGLMSVEVKTDHVFIHLIKSAPVNKGKSKVFVGVPGNLVALLVRFRLNGVSKGMLLSSQKQS